MKQKEIQELEDSYRRKELLSIPTKHKDLLKEVRRSLKSVSDELPKRSLKNKLMYFRTLPLIGELEIYKQLMTQGTISGHQRERLEKLERFYQELFNKKPYYQVMATDLENPRTKVVRFNPHRSAPEDLEFILLQNGVCYLDKRKLPELVQSFYDDSILGGSVIISVETREGQRMKVKRKQKKDNPILAVGKFFVGVDKQGVPILTADHYSRGDYHSKSLDYWSRGGKIDLFAYGPAAMLYLAEKIGINKLVFCETEMEEFGKVCGASRQQAFRLLRGKNSGPSDDRKSGVIAQPNNAKGVWQHSIYGTSSGRQITLDYKPISIENLCGEFYGVRDDIRKDIQNLQRLEEGYQKRLRLGERFQVMFTVLRIMEDVYLNHSQFKIAKDMYNKTIDLVKKKNADFSFPYVK